MPAACSLRFVVEKLNAINGLGWVAAGGPFDPPSAGSQTIEHSLDGGITWDGPVDRTGIGASLLGAASFVNRETGWFCSADDSGPLVLHTMNEYMAVEADGKRLATFPDVIATLGEDGKPLVGPLTVWQAAPGSKLTATTPVELSTDVGNGIVIRRTVSVDDAYMFTVKDEIENKTGKPLTLRPAASIQRHGEPHVLNQAHEGFVSGSAASSVQYDTYAAFQNRSHSLVDMLTGSTQAPLSRRRILKPSSPAERSSQVNRIEVCETPTAVCGNGRSGRSLFVMIVTKLFAQATSAPRVARTQ